MDTIMRTDQPDSGEFQDTRRSNVIWVHAIVDDMGLEASEFRIYAHLCRRAGMRATAWPGIKAMAEHCQMSRNTVRNALDTLEARGMIRITPRENMSHIYSLTDESEWTEKDGSPLSVGGQNVPRGGVKMCLGGGSKCAHEVVQRKVVQRVLVEKSENGKKTPVEMMTEHLPPDWLKSTDLLANLAAWAKARQEAGKPIRPTVAARQMAFLRDYSLDIAIEIVRQSADNGWQGLFPPKGKSGKQRPAENSAENLSLWGF